QRDLAEDAQAFAGVAEEPTPFLEAAMPIRRRLHDEDANGVNVLVGIAAGVGPLVDPVERCAVLRRVERIEPLIAVFALAHVAGGDAPLLDSAARIALALVEARRTDQAVRRPLE